VSRQSDAKQIVTGGCVCKLCDIYCTSLAIVGSR